MKLAFVCHNRAWERGFDDVRSPYMDKFYESDSINECLKQFTFDMSEQSSLEELDDADRDICRAIYEQMLDCRYVIIMTSSDTFTCVVDAINVWSEKYA